MSSDGSALVRWLVWGDRTDRVRAVWRILIPVVVGYLTLTASAAGASALGAGLGTAMLGSFAATTVVGVGLLRLSASLDGRPLTAYGYRLSRAWWVDVAVGTGIGTALVAATVAVARVAGSLRVTGGVSVPDGGTLASLLAFFVAFCGVAFYEEFIYRGAFVTNAVEGLSRRGVGESASTAVALVGSTAAFAAIHAPAAVVQRGDVGLVVAKTFLLGGLLGLAYLLTGELALPMGVHLGTNFGLINLFGLSGSADLASVPVLVAVETTAAGVWSPAHGVPIIAATAVGYALVGGWWYWAHANRGPETTTGRLAVLLDG
jgi:hypothetical protein